MSDTFVPRPVASPVQPAWPGETVTLPGRTLHVREAPSTTPDGEPAVFVHGLGGSSTNWTDLMGLLADRIEGVAIDLPGFGQSPPPRDGDLTPAGHARAVADLVEARFGAVPVHLFGNSMGGAIAVQLAARRPELVRSLTLVSPALPERVPRRTNVHLPVVAVPGIGQSLMRRYLALDAGTRAKATIDLCFADPSRVPAERLAEFEAEVRRRDALPYIGDCFLASVRGLLATYLDTGPERPWRLAERITAPTLLVYGRQDKLVNARMAYRATTVFRDARVVVLHDCGHVAMMEHPEEVALAWRAMVEPRPAA